MSRPRRLATLVAAALALTASAVVIVAIVAADVAYASETSVEWADDGPAAATPVTMQKLRVKERPRRVLERLLGRAVDSAEFDEARDVTFGAFEGY